MASPKSQSSSSAASPEELSEVQVLDSVEPLVTASFSVPSCSAQVIDSSEPLVSTLDVGASGMASPNRMASPSEMAGPSWMADLVMPAFAGDVDEVTPCGSSGRRIHYYAEELRSMWNWKKIFTRLGTHQQCIQFAEERGLIPTEKLCNYHHRPMVLSRENQLGRFRCRKSNCRNRSINRAQGTWFGNVRLSITLVFHAMYAFREGLSYMQAQKQPAGDDEHVVSQKTVADWYSYCREAIRRFELEHTDAEGKIGGPGKIVQIDESKFGKRKYNRGRQIDGHWVIGMIEDGNDDLRLETCPDNDRSAEILVPLIKKHIQEGSIIHTDYWRGYMRLPEHGYIHKRVNHSDPVKKFVAPDGTHTQRIESQWRGLKKQFRQEQNKLDFPTWLCEYSWRRKIRIKHGDPFEE